MEPKTWKATNLAAKLRFGSGNDEYETTLVLWSNQTYRIPTAISSPPARSGPPLCGCACWAWPRRWWSALSSTAWWRAGSTSRHSWCSPDFPPRSRKCSGWSGIWGHLFSEFKTNKRNLMKCVWGDRRLCGKQGGPSWSDPALGCSPVRPAPSPKHYACFMLSCRIPLKRLMPGSPSQPGRAIVYAACSDLLNEFISLAQTKSAVGPGLAKFGADIKGRNVRRLPRGFAWPLIFVPPAFKGSEAAAPFC